MIMENVMANPTTVNILVGKKERETLTKMAVSQARAKEG
jgi:hypothetical protein